MNDGIPEGAVVLAPDVREYFPDSDTVNQALRTLLIIPPNNFSRQDSHFRLSYATSDRNIDWGIELLLALASRRLQ